MLVEAGKEPESMLAGQSVHCPIRTARGDLVSASPAVVGNRDAARLSSGNVAAFQDDDFEAALDQFVRGAHAGYAAPQDDDFSGHLVSPRLTEAPLFRFFFVGEFTQLEIAMRSAHTDFYLAVVAMWRLHLNCGRWYTYNYFCLISSKPYILQFREVYIGCYSHNCVGHSFRRENISPQRDWICKWKFPDALDFRPVSH